MDKEQNIPPFENRIFKMAQARVNEHNAALESRVYNKPGPKTGHTVEITKQAIVVGRNKVPVPADEVEHMASLGCTDKEIAQYFGVTEDAIRRHFAVFMIKGRHQLRTTLRQAQLRVALEGNPTMLIWLGKNMLSQSDSGQANDDNRPLPWTDEMDDDVSDLEDEDDAVEVTEASNATT